jgi:hypothetical protein
VIIRCFRLLAVLTLSGLALLLASGCGGGLPGSAFVSIDGSPITRNTLEHWLSIAARAEGVGGAGAVPVPPAFAACIASLRADVAKGRASSSEGQLKSRCEQRYRTLVDEVAGFLITSQWVIDEAAELGVGVTDAEVHKQFGIVRRGGLATAASLEKFLASSGYTVSDLLLRVKLKMLSERIEAKVVKDAAAKVTQAQIVSFYAKNRSEYRGETLTKAAPAIRQQLAFTREQAAIAAFTKGFRKRWTPRTDCRAGFVVIDCRQYRPPTGKAGGSAG